MSKLRLIVAAILIISQLPLSAFAAPAATGIRVAAVEALHTVTGGACTTCTSDPAEPEPEPQPPYRIGSTYWEHTGTQRISVTNPGRQVVYEYQNATNRNITVNYQVTTRQTFSWSIGGGIPRGIVTATIGSSYDNTTTRAATTVVPPRTWLIHFVAHPTTRYHYTFTRFQDWSDGSRQSLSSGLVTASKTHPSESFFSSPL